MNSKELFSILEATYPEKKWFYESFKNDAGVEGNVIHFNHTFVAINDPLSEMDGDLPRKDFYGLSEVHAKLMYRHNQPYMLHAFICGFDLSIVKNNFIEYAKSHLDEDPSEYLKDEFFTEHHTGGGCMAYRLWDEQTREYLLVMDNEGDGLPKTFRESLIGRYTVEGDDIGKPIDIADVIAAV